MEQPATTTALRPWIASYPDGIIWDDVIDTTPVHEQVLAACAKNPGAVALDFLGGTTTFSELAEKIVAFAGALQSQFGVTKGTRVALMLPNTPFYPIAYYGVLRAGGTGRVTIAAITPIQPQQISQAPQRLPAAEAAEQ